MCSADFPPLQSQNSGAVKIPRSPDMVLSSCDSCRCCMSNSYIHSGDAKSTGEGRVFDPSVLSLVCVMRVRVVPLR